MESLSPQEHNDYTIKEMVSEIRSIQAQMQREQYEHHTFAKTKLEAIEKQAIKTNGRVSVNEREISKLKTNQEGILTKVGVGAFIVATTVTAFINKMI